MKTLELKVPPLVLVLITAALMWAAARWVASMPLAFPGVTLVAGACLVAGVGIVTAGVLQFRAAGTTVDPRIPDQSAHLVDGGNYGITRNPMYLGFVLILLAWGLYLGNAIALALVPLFMLYMNRFQIVPEERSMRALFGRSYEEYASRVRRWF